MSETTILQDLIDRQDKRIAELEQENERLRKQVAAEKEDGFVEGMQRALELCANHESIGAAEESIRAEIEK